MTAAKLHSMPRTVALVFVGLVILPSAAVVARGSAAGADPPGETDVNTLPGPVMLTAQEDHRRIMKLLQIESLRPGANATNRDSPNYANYDESKANPYPTLPDPLVLKNGERVTTADMWWNQRRPEIVEDFDREIYGRVPAGTPRVNWEVTSVTEEMNGDVPVIVDRKSVV